MPGPTCRAAWHDAGRLPRTPRAGHRRQLPDFGRLARHGNRVTETVRKAVPRSTPARVLGTQWIASFRSSATLGHSTTDYNPTPVPQHKSRVAALLQVSLYGAF